MMKVLKVIVDKLPKNCGFCRFSKCVEKKRMLCIATMQEVDAWQIMPDGCPLEKEKKSNIFTIHYPDGEDVSFQLRKR